MLTKVCSFNKLVFIFSLIHFGIPAPVSSQIKFAENQFYSTTAEWKPFILQTVNEINVAPPPGKEVTKKELAEVKKLLSKADEKILQQVKYWDAGAPSYRWNEITNKLVNFQNINTYLRFPTAWINMAIYDATLTAWKAKSDFKRKRPSQLDHSIMPLVALPISSSYPCEHTVTAAAAATVLAYFFPEKGDSIMDLARQAAQSRINAGVQFPSDVTEGWKLGEMVARKVIEHAKKDGSDLKYSGNIPNDPKLWRGSYPVGINVRNYKPIVLKSGDQFRPPAPPDFADEMKLMKEFKQDFRTSSLAFRWASLTGFDIWTELASLKIFEEKLDRNTPLCARIYALLNVVQYDAGIAIMDAKYAYWGTRPDLYDSTYHPLIGFTPPFPGYPSGHATASSAAATVLSYYFPGDKIMFRQTAQDCADSRFYAGIHFACDNKVGVEMGEKLALYIIDTWDKQNVIGKK